jgi:ribonucleotide reductase alpha subunit
MRYPYDSPEAAQLNREIFETIYFAALEASCDLAKEAGEAYPSYHINGGCPVSRGKLQFDMWRDEGGHEVILSDRWDWDTLRDRIVKYGVRNSLLVALMPTASTSQLLGNNESFEAYTNNIYVRTTTAGSYKVVNQRMILDLIEAGLWTDEMKNKVIYLGGSIQTIEEIPDHIRDLYKTAFDLSQAVIIDQAADRSPFIDQSQSLNIHIANPTLASVSSMHMYGYRKGLKTGMYYLRSQPAKQAAQVTVDPKLAAELAQKQQHQEIPQVEPDVIADAEVVVEGWVCTREEGCTSCSG